MSGRHESSLIRPIHAKGLPHCARYRERDSTPETLSKTTTALSEVHSRGYPSWARFLPNDRALQFAIFRKLRGVARIFTTGKPKNVEKESRACTSVIWHGVPTPIGAVTL